MSKAAGDVKQIVVLGIAAGGLAGRADRRAPVVRDDAVLKHVFKRTSGGVVPITLAQCTPLAWVWCILVAACNQIR